METECAEPYIFVPKAFTPNNDDNNDRFIVRGANIKELRFIVWDRWGEKVYETTDISALGWDGTYNGKTLNPGVFVYLLTAELTNGECDIMLFASNGKAVRFDEGSVRAMGRTATGVRGMKLAEGEAVRSLIVIDGEGDILTASERGFGKRTGVAEFPKKGRGTQGVIALKTTERNGQLVGAIQLSDHHDVLLISDGGTLVRTPAADIAQVGRNTQGVTLMRLAADETLQAIERLDASLDGDGEAGADSVDAIQAAPPPA